jgi:hypothetical protein
MARKRRGTWAHLLIKTEYIISNPWGKSYIKSRFGEIADFSCGGKQALYFRGKMK